MSGSVGGGGMSSSEASPSRPNAEMGSSFLSGHTGIVQVSLANNAAYLASWIRTLKGDAKLVIVAAAAAQKSTDYILNRQTENGQETACALAA